MLSSVPRGGMGSAILQNTPSCWGRNCKNRPRGRKPSRRAQEIRAHESCVAYIGISVRGHSVAERSCSFLDRVKMFVEPMTPPTLRRSGSWQDEGRKTQGRTDFNIAPCGCHARRPAAATRLKGERLTRLVRNTGAGLGGSKQRREPIAQEHRQ